MGRRSTGEGRRHVARRRGRRPPERDQGRSRKAERDTILATSKQFQSNVTRHRGAWAWTQAISTGRSGGIDWRARPPVRRAALFLAALVVSRARATTAPADSVTTPPTLPESTAAVLRRHPARVRARPPGLFASPPSQRRSLRRTARAAHLTPTLQTLNPNHIERPALLAWRRGEERAASPPLLYAFAQAYPFSHKGFLSDVGFEAPILNWAHTPHKQHAAFFGAPPSEDQMDRRRNREHPVRPLRADRLPRLSRRHRGRTRSPPGWPGHVSSAAAGSGLGAHRLARRPRTASRSSGRKAPLPGQPRDRRRSAGLAGIEHPDRPGKDPRRRRNQRRAQL